MRRLWAATAAMLVCLALGGLLAQAREASGEPGEVTAELLFEVTLPPGVMSDELERINTGGLTVAPGVEAVLGTDIEPMRGRLLYVESGEIVVTPMVDSPVWQGGAALGGTPQTVPAGEAVQLAPGDLIFLPVVAASDIVSGATTTIANPGTEPAVLRGFHGHARTGGSPAFAWPDGIAENEGFVEASDQDAMAAIMADGATFRATRLTAPVGASLPLDDSAMFTMVDVYDGKVERTVTAPEGYAPPFWNPIKGGFVPASPDWTFDLVVGGDSPAVVHELAVLPAAPGAAAADEQTDLILDIPAVVTVTDPATTPDFPKGSVMRADCQFVLRIEAEDGSAQEWQSCTLSDEPVMIPENQGVPPTTTVTRTGGECEWASDYWVNTDASTVSASAYELTVTPSGRVSAWSSYPAEPLVCPEE